MCSESAAVSRDLPMPGSPEISTTRPSPLFACCQRRISSSTSSSRPTSGVVPERKASNRLTIAALANDPPGRLRLGKAGERLRPEIVEIEQPADLPARRFGNDQRVRRGQRLQPGGEVRRLADDRRAPAPRPRRSDRRPRRARWRCRAARSEPRGAGNRPTASITASPARTARSASSSCACG